MNYNKKSERYLCTISSALFIVVILIAVTACSPHPGAGAWKADGDNSLKISSIKIIFEGTADIFSHENDGESKDAVFRCFWSASGEKQMQLQCVHAENTDLKETFQFTILETGQGKLTQNEQLIGLFQKSAITQ